MKNPLKILLGGVPFGRNNVGDEAILECVVKIVRNVHPDAQITVSTDDPETASRLGVNTVQLFGFEPPFSSRLMKQTLKAHDVFIWSGATGLSDYPEIPVKMLRLARRLRKKTVVWGVGMNNSLNPIIYSILPGTKQKFLNLLTSCTFHLIDSTACAEKYMNRRARRRISSALSGADLVVLRDPESLTEASRCGNIPGMITGADSALILEPADISRVKLTDAVRKMLNSEYRKIGICISAQQQVSDSQQLIDCFDELVEADKTRIVFVPMNPVTDAALMNSLRKQMKHPERTVVVEGRYEPSEILAIASKLDVVASSRLHLLILSSIVHVPLIGISRGSKVDNFLKPFGLMSVGNVDSCDFNRLKSEIERLIGERNLFETRSKEVRQVLLKRLDAATGQLRQLLC